MITTSARGRPTQLSTTESRFRFAPEQVTIETENVFARRGFARRSARVDPALVARCGVFVPIAIAVRLVRAYGQSKSRDPASAHAAEIRLAFPCWSDAGPAILATNLSRSSSLRISIRSNAKGFRANSGGTWPATA